MSEKFLNIKSVEVKGESEKPWLEITDQEDKVERVFPSMKRNDGEWVHLEKEIEWLKVAPPGTAIKLTKEKQGKYYNVIAVEKVEDVFQQKAIKEVSAANKDNRDWMMCLSYAKDCYVPTVQDKTDMDTLGDSIVKLAGKFHSSLTANNIVEVIKDETTKEQPVKINKDTQPALGVPTDGELDTGGDEVRDLSWLYTEVRQKDAQLAQLDDAKVYQALCKRCVKEGWNLPANENAKDFYYKILAPFKGWKD